MIKNLCLKCLLIATALTITLGINAQNVKLVKDINANTDANPSSGNSNFHPGSFAVLNGYAYFTAYDGIHGYELWRSDGTAAGTSLVKDIIPGPLSRSIIHLTVFRGKLLFIAEQVNGPEQIWMTDGTTAGTQLLKEVEPFLFYSFPIMPFTLVNDSTAYFVSSSTGASSKIWKTNGTAEGTVIVADLNTPAFGNTKGITNVTALNGVLYFVAYNNYGGELWRSNGTTAGTFMVKDVNPGPSDSYPDRLTVLNGRLYFYATDGQAYKLWVTNGKYDSVIAVASNKDILMALPSTGKPFSAIKNTLFLDVYTATGNTALYKYNTDSANGLLFVHNINKIPGTNSPTYSLTLKDSLILFLAYDSLQKQQLWVTNGHTTTLLKQSIYNDFNGISNLTSVNGHVFFCSYDYATGYEPWVSDGSVSGTHIVSDVFTGKYSSLPSEFSYVSANVTLFVATGGKSGFELWKTGNNFIGANLVKEINTTTTPGSVSSFMGVPLSSVNGNELLFCSNDFMHGNELWRTDGSASGTYLLKDALPGYFNGLILYGELQKFKNNYFYFSDGITDTITLWKTNGTETGSVPQDTFTHYKNYRMHKMAPGRSLLYFVMFNHTGGEEFWVTNGVSNSWLLMPYDGASLSEKIATIGDTAFFLKLRSNSTELWMSNGTNTGTKLVKVINSAETIHQFTVFNNLVFNGKLYFTAGNDSNGYNLWVSDGTASGTKIINNTLAPLSPDPLSAIVLINNKFCLAGRSADGSSGEEPWISDGTDAGTKILKDVNPGFGNSSLGNMINLNGILYFTADDGVHGREFWKTNGTDTGTAMIKDISPGGASINPEQIVSCNGLLYFSPNGGELWQSNGTEAGTFQVKDSGFSQLYIGYLMPSGNKLYFYAYSHQYGYELYVMGANSTLPVTMLSFTGQWVKNDAQLNWVTANELNSSHFNIQRSLNGTTFTTIGQVKAQGTTSSTYRYNYTDANAASLPASSLYYRLQQVDLDGNATYSNLVRLNLASNNTITIAPNPAHKAAYIISSTTITGAAVTIADMAGHTVYSSILNLQAGTQVPLNIAGIPAGVYNVTIQNGLAIKQQSKLVVQ